MRRLTFAPHHVFKLLTAGALLVLVAIVIIAPRGAESQAGSSSLTGWLWTETTGWISLNCTNPIDTTFPSGTCASVQYSVDVDGSGNLNGYGWSENIGWVKFGCSPAGSCLSGFPSGGGTTGTNAQLVSNELTGWARACAGTAPGDCSSMTSRADGWDGWISLDGVALDSSEYEVAVNASGSFKACFPTEPSGPTSCAWGSDVNGWVDFSMAQYKCTVPDDFCDPDGVTLWNYDLATCGAAPTEITCAYQCQAGACVSPTPMCGEIRADPSIVTSGSTTTISWDPVSNTGSLGCKISGNGESWPDPTGAGGSHDSAPIFGQATYTLTCYGPDDVTTCSASVGIIPSPSFDEI